MRTNVLFGPFDHNTSHRRSEKITPYILIPAVNAKHVTTFTPYTESHHAFTHSCWAVTFIPMHYEEYFHLGQVQGEVCRQPPSAVVIAEECFKLCRSASIFNNVHWVPEEYDKSVTQRASFIVSLSMATIMGCSHRCRLSM